MRFAVLLVLAILLAVTAQVVYADGEAPPEGEQAVVVVPPEEDPETENDSSEAALPAPEAPEEITAAEQPEVDTASQPAAEAESLDGFAPLTGEELLDCGAEADPSGECVLEDPPEEVGEASTGPDDLLLDPEDPAEVTDPEVPAGEMLVGEPAAESLTLPDPQFCPNGSTPGDPLCSDGRGTIQEALVDVDEDGTIYLEKDVTFPDSVTDIVITSMTHALTFSGGWNFDPAVNSFTPGDTSELNGPISIIDSPGTITFKNLIFGPAALITIDNSPRVLLEGTNADDEIHLGSVDNSGAPADGNPAYLTIDGGGGEDKVVVSGDITLNGGDLYIGAETIEVAHAHIDTGDGAITLEAVDDDLRQSQQFLPGNYNANSATITLDDATLEGGDITITAAAEDFNWYDDLGEYSDKFGEGLMNLLNQVPGIEVSAITGVYGQVAIRHSEAQVSLNGSTIESSGNVTLASNANADASLHTVSISGVATGGKFTVSVGIGMANSTARTTLDEGSSIIAAGSVEVTSSATTGAFVKSRTNSNLATSSNPKNISLALGVAQTNETAHVSLSEDSTITSNGSVKLDAQGKVLNFAWAQPTINEDGTIALAVALSLDEANVKTEVNGQVHASASGPENAFSANDGVDYDNDTITISGHGFRDGQAVTYSPGMVNGDEAPAIDGLEADGTYYVLVIDEDTIQLALAPAIDLDYTNPYTGEDPQHSLGRLAQMVFDSNEVDITTDWITLSGHGFSGGEAVVYNGTFCNPDDQGNEQNSGVEGLEPGVTYYIGGVNGDQIRLLSDAMDPLSIVDLTDEGAGTHAFLYQENLQTFAPEGAVDDDANTITIAGHGFNTGDAVLYHTDPTLSTQVVFDPVEFPGEMATIPDAPIGGLNDGFVYFVVVQDADTIRLTSSRWAAEHAGPINLEPGLDAGHGLGDEHTLTTSCQNGGICIHAGLEATNAVNANAEMTGEILTGLTALSDQSDKTFIQAEELLTLFPKVGKDVLNNQSPNCPVQAGNGFGVAGSIAINYADHLVEALVGSTAILTSDGDITVLAEIGQASQVASVSGATKPEGSGSDASVAVALGLGIFNNTARAIVAGGAHLDAYGTILIDSQIDYDFLIDDWLSPMNPADFLKNSGPDGYAYFQDGTLGYASNLFNTFVMTSASQSKVGAGGSIAINIYNNLSEARIERDAQINQNSDFRGGPQTVAVQATIAMNLIGVVGVGSLGFNLGGLKNAITGDHIKNSVGTKDKILGGVKQLVNPFGAEGDKGGIGASFLVEVFNNRSEAVIEGGAQVYTGADAEGKGLAVAADTDVFDVAFVQAGSNASSFAVSGAFAFGIMDNTTLAHIDSGAVVESAGNVTLSAMDELLRIGITGGIAAGENLGVGVSVSFNYIQRDTQAYIGAPLGQAPGTEGTDIWAHGPITLQALSDGALWTASLAAAVTNDQTPLEKQIDNFEAQGNVSTSINAGQQAFGDNSSSDQLKVGVGIAGDVSVNVMLEDTYAFINDTGIVESEGPLTLTSTSETEIWSLSGTVALALNKNGQSKGIAGSISANAIEGGTGALILGGVDDPVTVSAASLSLNASRSGEIRSLTAAGSGAPAKSGIAVAGSISVNLILTDLEARLAYADVTLTNSAAITARDETQIWSIGGAVAYGGKAGIGVGIAVNVMGTDQDPNETRAVIEDSTLTMTGGDLQVTAVSENPDPDMEYRIIAITGSLGIGGGPNSVAGAGTISVNLIHNDTQAIVRRSTITEESGDPDPGPLNTTVSAYDSSGIATISGAVGIAKTSLGAAVSYNEIENELSAGFENTTLTTTTDGSLTLEASSAGLIRGITVGVAVSTSSGSFGGAGSLSINKIDSNIDAHIANGANVQTSGAVHLTAKDEATIEALAGGIAAAGGTAFGAAVGINDIADNIQTYMDGSGVGADSLGFLAGSDATIRTLTVGGAGAGDFALGGAVSLNEIANTLQAYIANSVEVTIANGISLTAVDTATIEALAGGVAGAGSAAIGAAVATNDIGDTIRAYIDGSDVSATSLAILAESDSTIRSITVGGAGAGDFALGGAVSLNEIANTLQAYFANGAEVTIANGISLTAVDTATIEALAGGVAGAGGAAIGAAVATNDIGNTIQAYIASSDVEADILSVLAESDSTIRSITIGGSGAGGFALGGSVSLNQIANSLQAYIANGAAINITDAINLTARDAATIEAIAGGVAGAGGAAIGAAVATNDISNTVQAFIHGSDVVATSLAILAESLAEITSITVGGAGAGGFALGGSVSLNEIADTIEACIASGADVEITGAVSLTAVDSSTIEALAGGVAGAGGAAIGAAVATNDISNTIRAFIESAWLLGAGIVLQASSTSKIKSLTVGGAGAGGFALGGSVSLNEIANTIEAYISNEVDVDVSGAVNLIALDIATIEALAGGVAGAGIAAIGAALATNDIANTIQAYVENSVITSTSLTVNAESNTSITVISFGGAGAGIFALGGSVSLNEIANNIDAHISNNADVITTGTITLTATDNPAIDTWAGGFAGALGAGVGAAVATNDIGDTIQAYIDGASVTGGDITVLAASVAMIDVVTIGGAGAVGFSLGGSVTDNSVENTIAAYIANTQDVSGDDITVSALSWCSAEIFAGGYAGALGAAVGKSVADATIANQTQASIGQDTEIAAAGSFTLRADSYDNLLVETGGGTGAVVAVVMGDATVSVNDGTSASIADGASISAGEDLRVEAHGEVGRAKSRAEAFGGGLGAGADTDASTSVATHTSTQLGESVHLTARNITLLAESEIIEVTAEAESKAYAAGVGTYATAKTNLNDTTDLFIGENASLSAWETLSVEARSTVDYVRSWADAYGGAVGVDAEGTAKTTVVASTTTDIGAGASLAAREVILGARTVEIEAYADAKSEADAAGADSDAKATLNSISNTGVNLDDGVMIYAEDYVEIAARQEKLVTVSFSYAVTDGLGGDTDSSAYNTLLTDTTSNTSISTPDSVMITTRQLFVEAYVPSAPTCAVVPRRSGAWIDTGSTSWAVYLTLQRAINFDAHVRLLGAPSPELEIDEDGNVTTQVNVDFTRSPTEIAVHDIRNDRALAGGVTFSIPASIYDHLATAGGRINGSPTIEFLTGFEHVSIINHSPLDLRLADIEVLSSAEQLDMNVVVNAGDQSGFSPTLVTSPGETLITIENNGACDILLGGAIHNPFGETNITNSGGDILAAGATSQIETDHLILQAEEGGIGTEGARIRSASNLLTAHAGEDIFLNEFSGNLVIENVTSTSGRVDLLAAGSILEGDDPDGADVKAAVIHLSALTGGIGMPPGMPPDPLEIDAESAITALSASAWGSIFLTGVADGLSVAQVHSLTGDILLETQDAPGPGQDLLLETGTSVWADLGSVFLRAGDDLSLSPGSTLEAGAGVTLSGDYGNADTGVGAVIDLRGQVSAGSVAIYGGDDADIVCLTNGLAGVFTTIASGGGDDTILLGSNATPPDRSNDTLPSNKDGKLDDLDATLTIYGGPGDDTLELDDSGDTTTNVGTITFDSVTGFGMSSGVHYHEIEDLAISLGSNSDIVAIQSTHDGTVTTVNAGAGDDLIDVSGSGNTVNALWGLLEVIGGAGDDRLNVDDSGDPDDNTGVLTGTRLTGLGMGNANQGAIAAALGISYKQFEALSLSLGAGNDTFSAGSIAVGTETTINAGGGDDKLTLAGNPADIGARLLLEGGEGGNDELYINPSLPTNLTLDRTAGGLGRLTGDTMTAPVEFEGFESLTVDQGDDEDSFTIGNTSTPVNLNMHGGNDTVTVEMASHPVTIELGEGNDQVTVLETLAPVTIDGQGGGTDTLTVYRRSSSTPDTGILQDDADPATPDTGEIHGLTAGNLLFRAMEQVEVRLGAGNDDFSIDTSLPETVVNVWGGEGDDAFTLLGIGTLATNVSGGPREDTLTVVIEGFPVENGFTALNLDVETLVVDNTANSQPVAWTLRNGELLEADTIPVISTQGAQLTRILGGTGDDSLSLVTDTLSNIVGTIDENRIELASGLVVLEPAGFQTITIFEDLESVMTFDGSLGANGTYQEDGFQLSGAFSIEDLAASGTGTFTLQAEDGGGFAIYSLALASADDDPVTVNFTGTTLNGGTVTTTPFDVGGSDFQTVELPENFTALKSLSWSTDAPEALRVDDIVVVEIFLNADEVTSASVVPKFIIRSSSIFVFNTDDASIGSGEILVDLGDGVEYVIDSSDPAAELCTTCGEIYWTQFIDSNNGQPFSSEVSSGAIAQFVFMGDLMIENPSEQDTFTVGAVGSNGLSLWVANDVTIAGNVRFDFSAGGQNPGPGGGDGGDGAINGTPLINPGFEAGDLSWMSWNKEYSGIPVAPPDVVGVHTGSQGTQYTAPEGNSFLRIRSNLWAGYWSVWQQVGLPSMTGTLLNRLHKLW